MSPTRFWLVVAVVAVIIEILPPPTHFFFLCVAFGALGAAIATVVTTAHWISWVVFGATTIALTPMLIPLARFLFTPKPHASNADALVGEKALVLEPVSPKAPGAVKIQGEVWRATTEQDSFEKNNWVEVVKVEGTHVVVRRTV